MSRTLQMALDALDNLGSMSDKDVTPYAWRAELLKSLADNAPLREQVRVLEDARPEPDCRTCQHMRDETACAMSLWGCTNGDRYEPLPPVRIWRKV